MRASCVAIAVICSACAYAAGPEPVHDATVGLAVTPPAGYVARQIKPTGRYTSAFEVKLPSDRDTGCKVAFQPAPQNKHMSQAQINSITSTPAWQEQVGSTLGTLYTVQALAPFTHAGVSGASVVATLKSFPGDAANLRQAQRWRLPKPSRASVVPPPRPRLSSGEGRWDRTPPLLRAADLWEAQLQIAS
jgi:hypothetical protein